MGRASKPWYRKDRDAWYVNVQGKRIKLVDGKSNRNEVYRRFLALKPDGTKAITALVTGEEVCELFVEFSRTNLKPKTHDGYKRFLEPFASHVGVIDGSEVQPKHVTRFLEQCPTWGKTTRYNAITAIKRAAVVVRLFALTSTVESFSPPELRTQHAKHSVRQDRA
jgi:hypothetical protein